MIDVTVLLFDGNFLSTALGPIEVFHSAGLLWNALTGGEAEPRFKVTVASIDGNSVMSPYAVGAIPQVAIDDVPHSDVVIVPASGLNFDSQLERCAKLMPWLRDRYANGAVIGGICSGAAFLAEAGLLDGRKATTHWAVADELARRYPNVDWQSDRFITEDHRVLCSGGVYAAIDLSIYLVDKLCGHEVAVNCAKSLLVSMPRSCQSGYAVLPLSRPHSDGSIRDIETYLSENYMRDISVEAMASRANMSTRNFVRRFKGATGHLPGAYLQTLRITIAKKQLEDGARNIQSVGLSVGYEDLPYFRSLFKRLTGMNPSEYRSAFGPTIETAYAETAARAQAEALGTAP